MSAHHGPEWDSCGWKQVDVWGFGAYTQKSPAVENTRNAQK